VTDSSRRLAEQLQERFGDTLLANIDAVGEVTIEVAGADLLEVATALRDEPAFSFEILVDVCGIDYVNHGKDEWARRPRYGKTADSKTLCGGLSFALNCQQSPPAYAGVCAG